MKVIDIEANSLKPTQIWCVCWIDVDTGVEHVWRYDKDKDNPALAPGVYIGHNLINYDVPALNSLMGLRIDVQHCIDTLVCSRLFNQQVSDGHSLRAWGIRLGEKKSDFTEWLPYHDPDLERDRMDRCVQYCLQDCRTTLKLYRFLQKYISSPQWKRSLRIEHDAAILCRELHDNGFNFEFERARKLRSELSDVVSSLSESLQRAFRPRSEFVREISPRCTKFGTLSRTDFRWATDGDLSAYSEGAKFSLFRYVEFNPASPKQVIDRLNEAGWKPFEKTDGYKDCEKEIRNLRGRIPEEFRDKLEKYKIYGWKISEENLETLPEDAPEGCHLFVKHRMLNKRLQTLDEWLGAYDDRSGAIHGNFTHIGAWTHRMAHSDPNMGNAPSVDSKYHSKELKELAKLYGKAMRSLWTARRGKCIVGVDAEGIQLRVLAHYMNDRDFIEALISGKKNDDDPEQSTDVHSLNALKLGYNSKEAGRPRAKTWIYAWLLGAGVGKSAKILGCSVSESTNRIRQFIEGYPGLQSLKMDVIPRDASRGYFEGFDGRLIRADEYHMLAGYLQAGEQCIMKRAVQIWKPELKRLQIDYKIVNFVHDEWQTEVPDDVRVAEKVASVQMDSIRQAGEDFELNCPLAGSRKIGYNWYETH